jgi:hypothetical protein
LGSGNAFRKGCMAGAANCRENGSAGLVSGTVVNVVCGSRKRSPSYEKKKKLDS